MALFERRNDCKSSCTIYVVLIAIVFTISIGIGTYFLYYKYINHHKKTSSIKLLIQMGNIKEINIKSRTYNFFNDMINTKDFDINLLKTDKKSYKNIDIHYIGYITVKYSDHVKIRGVNPLYLILSEVKKVNMVKIS